MRGTICAPLFFIHLLNGDNMHTQLPQHWQRLFAVLPPAPPTYAQQRATYREMELDQASHDAQLFITYQHCFDFVDGRYVAW